MCYVGSEAELPDPDIFSFVNREFLLYCQHARNIEFKGPTYFFLFGYFESIQSGGQS